MRQASDEAILGESNAGAPDCFVDSALLRRAGAVPRCDQLYHFPGKSRAASLAGADHTSGGVGAAGVAASGLERAVSGARLCAIRELGARERPRWTRARGAPIG